MKERILFLCTGNSCRSQMAEGIANKVLSKDITIRSAGTEAHGVNLIAVEVMNDISIPISHHQSEKVNYKDIEKFDLIITLCGDARDKCPVIEPKHRHIHWTIDDPASFKGDHENIKKKYVEVRDLIFNKITNLKDSLGDI